MFGPSIQLSKKLKDEAEKPFWISFADLMTALKRCCAWAKPAQLKAIKNSKILIGQK